MAASQSLAPSDTGIAAASRGGLYKYYALAVLTCVAILNAADRQILAILAEAIKADLKIDDAQVAFLFGAAFITLYTLLGLPIARLADRMIRTRLLGSGLALWSAMTALSGFAPSFVPLATARFGVGVGEATANPVSYSLISDFFPRKRRALALGTYLAGLYLGGGLATVIGGQVLSIWPDRCGAMGLCSIRPWQAAFLVVGLPGLVLALLVALLRHPVRGEVDGHPTVPPEKGHWSAFARDLASVLPLFCTWVMWRDCGPRAAMRNLGYTGLILAAAVLIGWLTGDHGQWIALFVSVSAIVGWAQRTDIVDPALIRLTFRTPAFSLALAGFALMGCMMGAAHFWIIPYAIRTFAVDAATAGLVLGPVIALSSILGVIGGGLISDAWRARDPRGYAWLSMVALVTFASALVAMLLVHSFAVYAALLFVFYAASVAWSGACAAYAQDLVVPRMRATTAAVFALCITLVTMAGGPYAAGKIGQAIGSLAGGMISLLVLVPVALVFLLMAARRFEAAEATKYDRAGMATPSDQIGSV